MTILCALGCGTLGSSIISGIIDSRNEKNGSVNLPPFAPSTFLACVKRPESAERLKQLFPRGDVEILCKGNVQGVKRADVIVLGCKPQMCKEILTAPGMREALEGKLLVSILAGTTLEQLASWAPASTKIVRAMPNTPCKLRQGMTVISCENEEITEEERASVFWIFSTIGKAMFLSEKHMDACTALCGSGPAFLAVVLEAMVDGGVMMGLPRTEAQSLVAQTMLGTARMVLDGQHPALIRNAVATPGGCTISGLLTMEDGGIRSTMARTIQQATQHAAALGREEKPNGT